MGAKSQLYRQNIGRASLQTHHCERRDAEGLTDCNLVQGITERSQVGAGPSYIYRTSVTSHTRPAWYSIVPLYRVERMQRMKDPVACF